MWSLTLMSNSKIKIKQIASPIGRQSDQKKTLIGLNLNKIDRISILEDTPSVRGMVNKVKHLVSIIKVAD